jgi:tetratricopeptide (TPR) repeat protein
LILIYLLAIVFSIRHLTEPDTWWQLAAGNFMLEQGTLIFNDPFSLTFAQTPWINIKWGYEILLALFVRLTSPESLPILQAFMSCLLVWVLLLIAKAKSESHEGIAFTSAMMAGILLFLLTSAYRMNSRPEMFSHLFTALFIGLILHEIKHPSRRIFWLIPLQVLWSNLHDGYGIGLILILLWIGATLLEQQWLNRKNRVGKTLLVFAGACLATCINPYGWTLLEKVPAVFMQVQETKITTEFLNYTDYRFWSFEAYVLACMLGVTLALMFIKIIKAKNGKHPLPFFKRVILQYDLFVYLLLGAFVLLALTAHRNLIFLSIVLTPIFIAESQIWISKLNARVTMVVQTGLLLTMVMLYGFIVTNTYYKATNSFYLFGLSLPQTHHPVQAAEFLRSRGLTKNIYSDYRSSSYLLWKFFPEGFRTIIDLRDYEIYTPAWFDRYVQTTNDPVEFLKLDSQYQFKAVVLLNDQDKNLHRYLYHDSVYALVHWDQLCTVYQKRSKQKPHLQTQASAIQTISLNTLINYLLFPLYTEEGLKSYTDRLAGYFLEMQDIQNAVPFIQQAGANKTDGLWGTYYLNKSGQDTTFVLLDSAEMYFRRAIKQPDADASSFFGLGAVLHTKGQYRSALTPFNECLEREPQNLNAHLYLADCYEKLAAFGKAKENYEMEISHLRKAYRLNPENPFIETDLGFIYYKLNDCEKALPYLHRIKEFKGLSQEDRDLAKQYIQRCQ